MDLGPFHVVDGPLAIELHLGGIVGSRRRVVTELTVFDDALGDVDPEAGDAAVEPEAVDLVEGVTNGRVPPVEIRLLRKKVVQVVLARVGVERPGRPAKGAQPVIRRAAVRLAIGPDVPIAVGGRARGPRVNEPRVPITAVVGHDVEHDLDVALCRFRDQRVGGGQVAENRLHPAIVGDIVANISVRRDRDRVQPDGIDAQPLQVVEAIDDALQVTDAIDVGVLERSRIGLIDDAFPPPFPSGHRQPCYRLGRRLPAVA